MPNPGLTPTRDAAAIIINKMLACSVRGHTVREMATETGVSFATIRRILDPLRANGTVRAYPDPYNRQLTRYQLATNVAPLDRRK